MEQIQFKKSWYFTVDVDGLYTIDVYEGHSHPYPDKDLLACAKFCALDGKILSIIEGLGEWEFFTKDKELRKEIDLEPMDYFIRNAHIYIDEIEMPKDKSHPYGLNRNVYGAIHIWKIPQRKYFVPVGVENK